MMKWKIAAALLLCSTLWSACLNSNVYEHNVALPQQAWKASYKPVYRFDISDTASSYLLSFTMRHTEAYAFSNIWLNVSTKMPGSDKPESMRIEVPLAQPDGKWMGRGMNEIWQHQMPLTRNGAPMKFSRTGTYTIELEQLMRVDPLREVLSAGIRLEKIPK